MDKFHSFLSFEGVYHDETILEILIIASNGRYSGVTNVHLDASGKELIDFGNQLKGFPKQIGHIEEKEFGITQQNREVFDKMVKLNPNMTLEKAYAGFKFYCIDKAGSPAVHVAIQEDDWSDRVEAIGKAIFEIRFDPLQLDRFIDEIIGLGKNKQGIARLEGILDNKNSYM